MTADTPVLDTLADITAASVEHNSLAPRELMLVRIAALIAVDAPPASYLANAGAAEDSGVTADDIQGVMIAVAPVVGTAGGLGRREDPPGAGHSRSLWPTPRWPTTAMPGGSSNQAPRSRTRSRTR